MSIEKKNSESKDNLNENSVESKNEKTRKNLEDKRIGIDNKTFSQNSIDENFDNKKNGRRNLINTKSNNIQIIVEDNLSTKDGNNENNYSPKNRSTIHEICLATEAEKDLKNSTALNMMKLEYLKNDEDIKQLNKSKIEIKRSNSDESLFQEKRKQRSSIRFSIVNDNQSINDLNRNHYINVRRKSLHPNEAFVTSDEVNKARRLSIYASNDSNSKSSKLSQQRMINQQDKIETSSIASNGIEIF